MSSKKIPYSVFGTSCPFAAGSIAIRTPPNAVTAIAAAANAVKVVFIFLLLLQTITGESASDRRVW